MAEIQDNDTDNIKDGTLQDDGILDSDGNDTINYGGGHDGQSHSFLSYLLFLAGGTGRENRGDDNGTDSAGDDESDDESFDRQLGGGVQDSRAPKFLLLLLLLVGDSQSSSDNSARLAAGVGSNSLGGDEGKDIVRSAGVDRVINDTDTTIIGIVNGTVNNAPTNGVEAILAVIAKDSSESVSSEAELLVNADGDSMTDSDLEDLSGGDAVVANSDDIPSLTADPGNDNAIVIKVNNGVPPPSDSADQEVPVNDAPTGGAAVLAAIAEDSGARVITQTELLANASDINGDSLTATDLAITSGNGTLADNGDGTWSYIPDPNDDGDVSFSFNIRDGTTSTGSTATLDITPVNDAPTAGAAAVLAAIAEDSGARVITEAELLANASDIDGDNLSVTDLVITSGNGALVNNGNGTWSYTPAANDDTDVSFSFNIHDGTTNTGSSATLDITPVNDAPTAGAAIVLAAIAEDSGARLITQAELLANAGDIDADSLSATDLAISSGNGNLVDNGNGTWSYTPAGNDDSAVSFSFNIHDGTTNTGSTATLDITPVNDAPSAGAAIVLAAIAEDSGARVITQAELLANAGDIDADSLSATDLAITAGGGALVDNGNGTWSYTPAGNDDSAVSFSFNIHDGTTNTGSTATLDITPVNDAPSAGAAIVLAAIAEDSGARVITQAQLLANAGDIDGDSLTATNLAITSGGGNLVDNGDGTWSYTPAANDNSGVSFSFNIDDGTTSTGSTATLDITPVNDAPTAGAAIVLSAIAEDSGARVITQAQLLANATDIDADSLLSLIHI